jgi:hypothetical protein
MPGTENTVRIRSEFLGGEVFTKVDKIPQEKTVNIASALTKSYKSFSTFFTSNLPSPTTADKLTLNTSEKFTKQDIDKYYTNYYNADKTVKDGASTFDATILKSSLAPERSLRKGLQITTTTYSYLANVGEQLLLFFNRRPEKTLKTFLQNCADGKCTEPITLKFLDFKTKQFIVNNFIKNVILKKKDDSTTADQFMYFELVSSNDTSNDLLLEEIDFNNMEIIFQISKSGNNNYGYPYWNTELSGHGVKKLITQIETTYDLRMINDKLNSGNFHDIKTNQYKIKFYKGKQHPMIKYFIILINLVISNDTTYEDFIGIALLLIYKYVSFIVNQGSAIVTNLEHLKFFFLSNTDNVVKYNTNTNNKPNQSFECTDAENTCVSLLDEPRIYTVNTNIGNDVNLSENINIGNMKAYKLLSILQYLAGQTDDLDQLELLEYVHDGVKKYTLDLFHTKPKTTPESIPEEAPKTTTHKSALFVMFTNIKIFRDDSQNTDGTDNPDGTDNIIDTSNPHLQANLNLLCPAEFDTLQFAQSISSTTQGAAGLGGGSLNRYNYKTSKFHLNTLTRKQKNIKTHKSITLKKRKQNKNNNNNKRGQTLFVRRSKKYFN